MASDPIDATSEPLLSSHHYGEEHTSEAFNDSDRPKPRNSGTVGDLLRSKYVVGCALFSSIGGLIFGYGTKL